MNKTMTTNLLRLEPQKRLYSLDALRGFDMFWITGGGEPVIAVLQIFGCADAIGPQFNHVDWEGFHFCDLIFPLFMFIAGVAIPYSLKSLRQKEVPRQKILLKAFKRLVALVLLGIIYNGLFQTGFRNVRFPSVLGQIGFAYFFASVIVVYFKSFRSWFFWLGGILAGIGIIQLLIPVPGFGAGILTPEGCINGYIDRMILPGRLNGGIFDPEGILCCLSATGISLMGAIAGNILLREKIGDWKKLLYFTVAGILLITVAILLSPVYPIIKSCCTSTFSLLSGGISLLLLVLFYLIIDHWGFRKWAFYFRVIGMNSIFVYLFTRIVDVNGISDFFLGSLAKVLGENGHLLLSLGNLLIIWSLLYYMYKKKIFLRV